jgi:Uma2 family endonuclease
MLTTIDQGEQRVLLRNISWQLYESLLQEIGDEGQARLSYLQGDLEFMTPLPQYETFNRQIDRAITTIAEELNQEYNLFGSMTVKRPKMAAGAEPDSCYYIANESAVRGKIKLDFEIDPPPDLVLEIDITSSSLDRMSIYAKLGVGELWRYDGTTMVFHHLQAGEYVEVARSPTFPMLSPARILEFIADCQTQGILAAVKTLRTWIQRQDRSPTSCVK